MLVQQTATHPFTPATSRPPPTCRHRTCCTSLVQYSLPAARSGAAQSSPRGAARCEAEYAVGHSWRRWMSWSSVPSPPLSPARYPPWKYGSARNATQQPAVTRGVHACTGVRPASVRARAPRECAARRLAGADRVRRERRMRAARGARAPLSHASRCPRGRWEKSNGYYLQNLAVSVVLAAWPPVPRRADRSGLPWQPLRETA